MIVNEFIKILEENLEKELLFEYDTNKFAGTNYHLTEVKNVAFNTVDCGGNPNQWKETHLQLWESPNEIGKEDYLTVDKALSILNKVNGIQALWLDTELKVEFGNENIATSVMKIDSVKLKNTRIIVQLFTEKTLCKSPGVCNVEINSSKPEKETESTCCSTNTSCC